MLENVWGKCYIYPEEVGKLSQLNFPKSMSAAHAHTQTSLSGGWRWQI